MESLVVAGLDVGSSKITVIIAQKGLNNNIIILGVGISKSLGIRKGNLINIEKTSECIAQAIQEAEIMAGIEIQSIFLSLSGSHIYSKNEKGIIAISNQNQEIGIEEIQRVIEAAKMIHIPLEKKIIHVIPWEFRVDDQEQIRDPIGMKAIRLEANVHIVTASAREIHNLTKSIQMYGLDTENYMLASIASAEAVLTTEEKENCCLLIDIGAGTSDAVLFCEGSIRYTQVFPFAGQHINQDISIAFKIPENLAESIKIKHGNCFSEIIKHIEDIEIPSNQYNQKKIQNLELSKIIEARLEEILLFFYQELEQRKLLKLITNIVITGGTGLTNGMQNLVEKIFNLPIRIGIPKDKISGLTEKIQSPEFSTAIGLAIYNLEQKYQSEFTKSKLRSPNQFGIIKKIKFKLKNFFNDFLN